MQEWPGSGDGGRRFGVHGGQDHGKHCQSLAVDSMDDTQHGPRGLRGRLKPAPRACFHCAESSARSADLASPCTTMSSQPGKPSIHMPEKTCPLGSLCPRLADLQLDTILAEAAVDGQRDGHSASGGACEHAQLPARHQPDCESASNSEGGEDRVLQALRRYRAAAWW